MSMIMSTKTIRLATPSGHNGHMRPIRECRLARGWSMAELATQLGISATHINKLEKGQRSVTPAMAIKLGELFQRDPREFGFDPYLYLSARERTFLTTLNQLSEQDQDRLILASRAWLEQSPPTSPAQPT